MSSKSKKNAPTWFKCDKCQAHLVQKDMEIHLLSCQPSMDKPTHPFIESGILNSSLEIKTNEEIKGLTFHDKNNLVFLSQSAIQLCSLVIGDWAVLKEPNSNFSCAKMVWPTAEKSVSSVLITQTAYDLYWKKQSDVKVTVSKINMSKVTEAREIVLTPLNAPKTLQLNSEINLRVRRLHLDRLLTNDNKLSIMFYGKQLDFLIKKIIPCESDIKQKNVARNLEDEFQELNILEDDTIFFKVTKSTIFKLYSNEKQLENFTKNINPLSLIGGVDNEISEIRDIVNVALGKIARVPGMKYTRGLLLYGSSGVGKTIISNAIARVSKCHIVSISGTDLYSKYTGETEATINNLFKDALDHSPSIILLDEIDILCPLRSSRITDQEKRVVSTILTQLDNLHSLDSCDNNVCVIATSNRPDSIDPAFRRCGRLDREIEIPIPNPKGRQEIVKKLLSDTKHKISDDSIRDIANSAHGFVGSDLSSLCSRAALHAVKRCDGSEVEIELEDLKFALRRVRPSAMREVQIEVPDVKWSDIGGQQGLKLILKQAVEWPLLHPESFRRMGINPARGVLMYGPPGCSKTMIAKALATESGLNFLSIKGPELFSKWVGESERAVREVFRKARQVAPSVVFFDEIDAIGGERATGNSNSGNSSVQERVLAQLLTELDGVTPLGDVTVLAATNRPDRIDKALLRPGRLDRIVYVPLPDPQTRTDIFKLKLAKMPVTDVNIDTLVQLTDGYSGAEIQAICHEAAMKALEENIEALFVTMEHFEKALKIVTRRTPESLLKIYEGYLQK